MNRYYTVMIVPEREKAVRSIRIPRLVFKSLAFMLIAFVFVISIFIYDYYQIVQQVYQNIHLTNENKELREQIQLFQMKMNALTNDINRIMIFEEKLKVITGLEKTEGIENNLEPDLTFVPETLKNSILNFQNVEAIKSAPEYNDLKQLYDQKIASIFGMQEGYAFTKNISKLIENSFNLSDDFSLFDYKYNTLKKKVNNLELSINQLDRYLLDRESLLRSTPSLFPARGWITSYYGPRKSPYSGRMKMHEGLDIGGKTGTPILAPADGVVVFSGKKAGFGKFVQIDHGYGIETIFGHSYSLHVDEGEIVKRGQKIATIGSTGQSTGPHLHYEVRVNGIAVDPLYYILD